MNAPLSELLPRRLTRVDIACTGLDQDGNACRHRAVAEIVIHGDPELNHDWFHGFVCDQHMPEITRMELNRSDRITTKNPIKKKPRST